MDWNNMNKPYATTYGGMNDWIKGSDIRVPGHMPTTVSDANWREVNKNPHVAIPRATMPSEKRTDEFYRRLQTVSDRMSQKFPNIPAPRERQGRIGGSWRHIKEVLGHAGSRVVFVDGLVGLYDGERKKGNTSLMSAPGNQLRATPLYGVTHHDLNQNRVVQPECERLNQSWGGGNFNQALATEHLPISARDTSPRSKYKGFYALKRQNTSYY